VFAVLDNTQAGMKQHRRRGYVVTDACEEAERVLMSESGVAVISGNSGDGKTCMAWELVCRVSTKHGLKPAKISTARAWRELVNAKIPMVVFIDDLLGTSNMSLNSLGEWLPILPGMAECVTEGLVRLVLPIRRKILNECWDKIHNFDVFNENNIVDLTSKAFQLTENSKTDILKKHLSAKEILICDNEADENLDTLATEDNTSQLKISRHTVSAIVNSTSIGFPQSCRQFVHARKLLAKGAEFFRKPDLLQNEINSLWGEDDARSIQFCTLMLAFLNGGHIDQVSLQARQLEEMLGDVAQCCGVKYTSLAWLIGKIQNAAVCMQDVYLTKTHGNCNQYEFTHPSVSEAVGVACYRFPKLIIQHCNWEFLSTNVITTGCVDEDQNSALTIDPVLFQQLGDRFTMEVMSGNVCQVAQHVVCRNKSFLSTLFAYWRDNGLLEQVLNITEEDTWSWWSPCRLEKSMLAFAMDQTNYNDLLVKIILNC
jgi:hypothetical protein